MSTSPNPAATYTNATTGDALGAGEPWYQLLFERSPAPMWVYDRETLAFLAVNDAAVRAYGWSREEFLTMRIADIRPSDDVSALVSRVAELGPGLSSPTVWRHRTKDGDTRLVQITSADLPHDDRSARLVMATDITEAESARGALARSQAQLAEAQRVAQLGSWEWDLETMRMRGSDELFRLAEREPHPEPMELERFLELVHPEDRGAFREALEATRRDGRPMELQYRVRLGDGVERRMLARAELIRTASNMPRRVVGTAQDITERLRTEARMTQAHKAEAVARLAAGIAHDFNNVLTTIRCSADLLAESVPAGDERRQDIDDITRAADRAARLTKQLLAFARQQVVEPRVMDINALITEFGAILARALPEDVEQVLTLDRHAGRVRVDRDQLQQVLLALAMNARDAMPDGGVLLVQTAGVTLDARYKREHPGVAFTPGPYVMLGVYDTGVGMDKGTQARIFEPFFTTKEPGKGTGLGLASVYGIVKQAGGFIWATSEPMKGTRFSIYLPRVDEDEEPEVPAEAPPPADVMARGETVLVVEDEPVILELTARVLQRHGYTVLRATGGEEALAAAAAHAGTIDLLLTDVVMPRLGGPALAERLQAARTGLRVLYMSGYTEGDIVQHRVLQRGVHLLEKPFTPRQVVERVRRVLDAGRAG